MSKPSSDDLRSAARQSNEFLSHSEPSFIAANDAQPPLSTARLLGHPEGPFGTAIVFKGTILLRSLGAARFSRFDTLELAPNGIFVVENSPAKQPFQAKSTLLEFQMFLGEPQVQTTQIIKGVARIEEIQKALDLPVPTPSGYIMRILQIGAHDRNTLETFVHEHLLKAAM